MGPEYLLEHHKDTEKTKSLQEWTKEKAEMVLSKWNSEMKKIIKNESNKFYILTSEDFYRIVDDFCKLPIEGVTIAYSLWVRPNIFHFSFHTYKKYHLKNEKKKKLKY